MTEEPECELESKHPATARPGKNLAWSLRHKKAREGLGLTIGRAGLRSSGRDYRVENGKS